MSSRHGGHVLADVLVEHGISTVFTLCGNHTLAAYEGLVDAGITLVDTRTEAGAAMAADGYARATRRPAVALVTGGPGHTNALTGLATAHAAGSPVILLSGQTDLSLTGKGAQQEMDQVGAAAPLCKSVRLVHTVEELPNVIREAFTIARSGTTGAVHVSLPSDVIDTAAPAAIPSIRETPPTAESETGEVSTGQIVSIANLLANAKRPVVIAGSGAFMAHAETALRRLLGATGLPLFTVDLARGLVPDNECLGYADPSLNQRARRIHEADVVLLLGKTLDFRLRFGDTSVIAEDCALIDIHAVGANVDQNRERDISLAADIATVVGRLADEAAAFQWRTDWRDELAASPQLPPTPGGPPADTSEAPFHPLQVARALRTALSPDVGLVLDAGDFVQWCRSVLPANGPGRWLRLGPMSTCGAGTPLAMGLKCAEPDIPVVLLTGDGSFGYYLIEFEAALRQNLPFVAIVGHNSAWGLEYNLQRGLYGDDYVVASELSPVRYDLVIEALGGYGERVTSLDELGPAIRRAISSGRPACVEVPVLRTPSPMTNAVIARGGEV